MLDTAPSLKGWPTWFAAAGVLEDCPPPALSVDNHALLYDAAVAGLGVALGASALLGDHLERGVLVQPLDIKCQLPPSLGMIVNERTAGGLARAFAVWLAASLSKTVEIGSTPSPVSETPAARPVG